MDTLRSELGGSPTIGVARTLLSATWTVIRLPVLAVLIVFEPFVRVGLTVLAVLGFLFTFFFEYLIRLPKFPFWTMLALSTALALGLPSYYALMRLFGAPMARLGS